MLEQYIRAIESSNIVSRTDIDGIITFVNDEFCKISGYSREELIGHNHNIVRHPDVPASNFKKLWDTILDKKTYKATVKNLAKDGSTFYVNTTIVPILDERGEILEFVAIRYDVTREMELRIELERQERELERLNKDLEKRVRIQTRELQELNQRLEERVQEEIAKNEEKQKMLLWQSRFASLGQMTANIAHQWRQPLTELNLSLFSLKNALENHPDPKEIRELYAQSRRIIRSMSKTIEDFMDFFRPNRETSSFRIQESLQDALALIQQALEKAEIEVRIEGEEDLTIRGIPNELTQVFLNLFQNAKEAFAKSSESPRWLRVHLSQDEHFAVISIEDNAGGIPPESLERIFEPYFSTKHSSQGTGLGLFMSRMIIQKSFQGSIEAINSLKGALFVIKIPLETEEKENQ